MREVRPAGPGWSFIVAYDGHLTGGEIRVEPHGRGAGSVVTLPLDDQV